MKGGSRQTKDPGARSTILPVQGTPNHRGSLLFVAPSAYPLGGLATWLDYLVPGLRDKGWKVTIGLTAGQFHNVDAYQ